MDSDDNENVSNENSQEYLEEELTGLREKRLLAMVVCLLILFFITLLLLVLNILIFTTLRMDHTGVKFLRFHQSQHKGRIEKVGVFFSYKDQE